MKHVIIMFQSTTMIINLTAKSGPQYKFLMWNIKLRCQNDWNYLFSIHNIFIVGAIMLSISNSWNSIETKWYLVPSSFDTKASIFKRKFQFKQQIFHCSKKKLRWQNLANLLWIKTWNFRESRNLQIETFWVVFQKFSQKDNKYK